jgi:predicted HAD superfamily Cof-like phosphohydrolase
MSNFEDVKTFMKVFKQEVKDRPEFPDTDVVDLRFNLIQEEVFELSEAIDENDIVAIADALADILYVTYGAAASFGIDLDACFAEVHRSNMSKLNAEGKPVYRVDGKILKSNLYSPPDLKKVLFGDIG